MKRIWQKGISLFLVICFAVSLFPAPAFAAWQHGDKGNADFTKILIGKDGKEYYINEDVKTVFYSNNGKKTTKSGNGRKKVRWRYLKISDTTDKGSKYGYCAEFGASFSDQANYKASDSTKGKNLFKALPSDAQPFVMEETDRERYRFPEQMTRIITLQHRFSSGKHSRDCGRLPKKTGL